MRKLFINASRDRQGNTARLAKTLLGDRYVTINLIGLYLHQMGQKDSDDFAKITQAAQDAQVIVFGTPIYFGNMSGSMKTLIDRMNEMAWDRSPFKNKDLYLIISYTTTPEAVKSITRSVKMLATAVHMNFKGTITSSAEANQFKVE